MHTLSFEIDYAHEHHGWIDCTLTVNGTPHHLSASGALPPFLHLMYFIKAAAGQNLPYTFFWDEEGYGAKFEVAEVIGDSSLVHLKIVHRIDEKVETWIDADVARETVAYAFLTPLVDFAQNYALVDKGWELPRRVVKHIQSDIAKGLPLCADPNAPKHADIIIYPSYFSEITEDHVNLQLWVGDHFAFHIGLMDTDPFWKNLVEFLSRIASTDFPAEFKFTDNLHFSVLGALIPSFEQFARKYRLVASAADESENFRLQMYFTEAQSEDESLVMDEIINRQQVTHAFVESFGEFLRDHYQVSVDGNGKVFDLRGMSLEKLI